jgi:divalent metal cation (Fe/Co/Zn/Cd) transporter
LSAASTRNAKSSQNDVLVKDMPEKSAWSRDLIDTMPPTTLIEKVRATAMQVHGVVGVEKLLGRKVGLQRQLDLHLEVNPTISVSVTHEIAANVRENKRGPT